MKKKKKKMMKKKEKDKERKRRRRKRRKRKRKEEEEEEEEVEKQEHCFISLPAVLTHGSRLVNTLIVLHPTFYFRGCYIMRFPFQTDYKL